MNISGQSSTKDSKYNATLFLFKTVFMLGLIAFLIFYVDLPGFVKFVFGVFSLFVLAHAYQAYRNSIFSKKDLPFEETEYNLTAERKFENRENTHVCYTERLRNLEAIYSDGLLTKKEYEEKRKDILNEDWSTGKTNK